MRSLRARLSVAFALAAGALVVVAIISVSSILTASVDKALDDSLRSRLDDVSAAATSGSDAVVTADQFAQVVAADGRLMVDSSFGARGPVLAGAELADALGGPRSVDRPVDGLSSHARLLSEPATVAGEPAVVVVGTPIDTLVDARSRARLLVLVFGPVAVVVLGGAAWLLIGAVLRPITRLTAEAARLSVRHPGRRLAEPAGDTEVAQLARQLNVLLDRVEAALEGERQFVDDASHELRTPLTIMRGEIELAALAVADAAAGEDEGGLEAARQSLAVAVEEAERLSGLAEELLVLARLDRGELRLRRVAVNPRQLAAELAARLPERPRIAVEGDDVLVNADAARLEQVLLNLLGNAQRHARSRVRVTTRGLGPAGVELEVADDGPGFSEAIREQAFQRFRRADPARRSAGATAPSTGLGLAIVAAVVLAHGGTVSAENGPPLGGAVVRVQLPSEPPSAGA